MSASKLAQLILAAALVIGVFCAVVWMHLRDPLFTGLYLFALVSCLGVLGALLSKNRLWHFASSHELVPVRRRESEHSRLFRLAGLFLFGGLLLPLSLAVVELESRYQIFGDYHDLIVPIFVMPLPVLGVACLLKSLGALWSALRAWRNRSKPSGVIRCVRSHCLLRAPMEGSGALESDPVLCEELSCICSLYDQVVDGLRLQAAPYALQRTVLPDFVHLPDEVLMAVETESFPRLFDSGLIPERARTTIEQYLSFLETYPPCSDYDALLKDLESGTWFEELRVHANQLLAPLTVAAKQVRSLRHKSWEKSSCRLEPAIERARSSDLLFFGAFGANLSSWPETSFRQPRISIGKRDDRAGL